MVGQCPFAFEFSTLKSFGVLPNVNYATLLPGDLCLLRVSIQVDPFVTLPAHDHKRFD